MHLKFLLIILLFQSFNALSICLPDMVDYSLEGELKRTSAVIIATPVNRTWEQDKKEPEFYSGAIYQLEVHDVIYTSSSYNLELWDPNDSGRFAPDIGQRYLMFMLENEDGSLSVDYCGNSGLLSEREGLVPKIRSLMHERRNLDSQPGR
ncbi:hypothetical protein JF50_11475 [Pseudoalteromonas luteoviolacea]|uniref:Uncharacterized protein n=1 Tax=Pseudoalteromonas luteoviolacea TaxID=43657 RepID=A0A0C1QAV6_9GAMM|nr:hypothetical protein JF50_11475 [Pseudoalteromonas luteoviolacea]